jgi:hypothetical protein
MMADLFARALQAGIEIDYVRRFILERDLSPGNRYPEHWPWLIRVHTLGFFEVRHPEGPVQLGGKAKQRILELLKVIVAFGPHGAALDTIAQILWPQAEGDAANDALRVALHRLRKLLGTDRAVIVSDGKASSCGPSRAPARAGSRVATWMVPLKCIGGARRSILWLKASIAD